MNSGDGRSGTDRKLRVCLAGSGGGHVRQLLDLAPAWQAHDAFFVTEDTALGRSLAEKHRVHFVSHYALGQARLGNPFKMMTLALKNLLQSIRIIWRERPEIVISTGAGAVFFASLFARILGAEFVLIDSFARFDHPSAFARIGRPFAHHLVVQSPKLKAYWPGAHVFDPLRLIEGTPPPKEPMIFATVGATLSFDRMAKAMLALKEQGHVPEQLIVQTGDSEIADPGMAGVSVVRTLPFDEIQALLQRASIVITHGGTGSLITALKAGCKVIAMPRSFERGEHYDNHQFEITSAFRARGLIDVVLEEEEMIDALARARSREPVMATTDPSALIGWLTTLIATRLAAKRAG